jgi:type II secretory pathway pseudopilin PulG
MTQRDRVILVVVLAVGALGAYWMLALKPKRQEAAKLGQDLSSAQQRLDQARTDLQAGQAARSTFAANYSAVARLGKAVPSDDDVPSLVYQLDSTAKSTGVDFRSVKLKAGSNSAPATTTAANAAAATSDNAKSAKGGSGQNGATGGSSGSAGSTPTSPAAATQAGTATLPPGAVVGPAGLSTMPFSFRFTGSFFRLSDFLSRLDHYISKRRDSLQVSGRLLLVDGIALNASPGGFPNMQASIAATAYLVPPDQGTFSGATPQGPPAAGSAQPASTSAATPGPASTPPATVKP